MARAAGVPARNTVAVATRPMTHRRRRARGRVGCAAGAGAAGLPAHLGDPGPLHLVQMIGFIAPLLVADWCCMPRMRPGRQGANLPAVLVTAGRCLDSGATRLGEQLRWSEPRTGFSVPQRRVLTFSGDDRVVSLFGRGPELAVCQAGLSGSRADAAAVVIAGPAGMAGGARSTAWRWAALVMTMVRTAI